MKSIFEVRESDDICQTFSVPGTELTVTLVRPSKAVFDVRRPTGEDSRLSRKLYEAFKGQPVMFFALHLVGLVLKYNEPSEQCEACGKRPPVRLWYGGAAWICSRCDIGGDWLADRIAERRGGEGVLLP